MNRISSSVFFFSLLVWISCGNKKTKELPPTAKDSTTQTQQLDTQTQKQPVQVTHTSQSPAHYNNHPVVIDESNPDPNASPQNVVKTIIKAAKTSKYSPLRKICTPAVSMDGDAKDICDIENADPSHQQHFNEYFGSATIVGQPRIKKNVAEVDIETPAEGGRKETIVTEQKYGKWYLKSL